MAKKLDATLRAAVQAPSSHNSQPWHFVVDDESITLCADRTRALPVVDPFDRELIISCGAALFNLRVALNHFGLAYEISLFPSEVDPDVLARLRLHAGTLSDPTLERLFGAIARRATTRKPFARTPVTATSQRYLIEAGEAEGAHVVCIDQMAQRDRIAELIAEADALQFADPRFRRELACWIHPQRASDGMPAEAAGMAALLDFAVPIATSAIRTFDLGGGAAAMHHELIAGTPLIVVIGTDSDGREAWLAAGQALERVLLTAANGGLSVSYLNQPIEAAALRERLRTIASMDAQPQLLLRIGYGPEVTERAPRRPLDDVLW
ncbi:nitroreductase family protein [Paraburkholderia sp. NMBU_R16]|uniref:Acg family FMN-binding oxidoreductase n=1 Tax=Paraburkholderia sp. NMBU_R16 TaxID=2698676 RepID=UPI0020B6AE9C|nr:nitroreductase family protein [Paraburkholderia sp. NMBU_R16]